MLMLLIFICMLVFVFLKGDVSMSENAGKNEYNTIIQTSDTCENKILGEIGDDGMYEDKNS